MPYPVHYSRRAYIEYESILKYISDKFGSDISIKVDAYFEEVIYQISINPSLFPYSDKNKTLRRCVINFQKTL